MAFSRFVIKQYFAPANNKAIGKTVQNRQTRTVQNSSRIVLTMNLLYAKTKIILIKMSKHSTFKSGFIKGLLSILLVALIIMPFVVVRVSADPGENHDNNMMGTQYTNHMNMMDEDMYEVFNDDMGVHVGMGDLQITIMRDNPYILFSSEQNTGFMLMFLQIREVNVTGQEPEVLKTLWLDQLSFQQSNPEYIVKKNDGDSTNMINMTLTAKTVYYGRNLTIEIPIVVASSDMTYNSGGNNMVVPANALKFAMNVYGWNFSSPENKLEILFRYHPVNMPEDMMKGSEQEMMKMNEESTGAKFEMNMDDVSSELFFEKYAILDGTAIPVNIDYETHGMFEDITVRVSSFNESMEYDPYVAVEVLQKNEFKVQNWLPYIMIFFMLGTVILLVLIIKNEYQSKKV